MANRPSRIVVPVYAPSFDGRYWGRYPLGDKPNTGAELAGDAHGMAGASGALSTAIRLAAQANTRAAAAAGLSTAIRLAGGASAAAAASGSLTTNNGNLSAPGIDNPIVDDDEIIINNLPGETFGPLGPDLRMYDDYRNAVHDQVVSNAAQIGQWGAANARGWVDSLLPKGRGIRCIRSDSESGVNANIPMQFNADPWTEMFYYGYVYVPTGYRFPAASALNTYPSSSDFKFPWFHDIVGGNEGGNIDEGADVMAISMIGNGTWRHWLSNDFGSVGSGLVWTWGEPTLLMAWAKGNGLSATGTDGMIESSNSTARSYGRYQNERAWFTSLNESFYWRRMNMPGYIRQGARYPTHNLVTAQTYLAIGAGCNARVLITDSQNWSTSRIQTICTVATQSDWTNTQIRCRVRRGRHPELASKYVHIIRADEAHSNGGVGRLIS